MENNHNAQPTSAEHEIDQWLVKLTRSKATDVNETTLLRQTMLDAEKPESQNESMEHDWQRLRFAIKREERAMATGLFKFLDVRHTAQAALVLVAVFSVYFMLPGKDDGFKSPGNVVDTVMRGKNSQQIFSRNIQKDADRMYGRLVELGVKAEKNISTNQVEIKITLIYPLNKTVRDLLQGEDIPIPTSGDLTLVFIPAARLN